jgi:phage terminase large subunit-like protein
MANSKKIAENYANNVLSGEIIACKWVKLACKRFLDDLENGEERGIYFDEVEADRVLNFFGLLKCTKGEWFNKPIELGDWQVFVLVNVFGWKKEDGTRRFRTVYEEIARKNGKTEKLGGIGLYLFAADREPGAEVYTVATKLDQAKIMHKAATMMVRLSSQLRERISIFKNNLNIEADGSKFEPLGSDSKTQDGLNISGGLVDELHAHKTRDMWDVIDTATGARRQPMIYAITTAGFDRQSVCWEQHEYTEKVLEGLIDDDSHFGIIFTLDEDDDWMDESVWIKANPNLHVSVKIEDMRAKARKAKEMPTQQNSFLRLHMNVWTESVTRWISADKWEACKGDFKEESLIGRPCYGGLDLSTTTDLSSLVLVFPPTIEGGSYDILCRFWIPKENMSERVRRDRVPYDVWASQDFICPTPGNVIDYSYILKQIDDDAKQFDLREIAFDRWGATKVIQDLQDMGFEDKSVKHAPRHLIDFGQGFASMSAPTKEFEKMVLSKELRHNGNPVLAWNISNTVIKQDPSDNYKPDKSQSTERIDGTVASIMALSRALQDDGGSVYDDRGIISI